MHENDGRPGYTVIVADNFHYMDEAEHYRFGVYATPDAALAACREIVERSLREAYRPGMSAAQLLDRYRHFGDDPSIRAPPGAEAFAFSGFEYAREQSERWCAGHDDTDVRRS